MSDSCRFTMNMVRKDYPVRPIEGPTSRERARCGGFRPGRPPSADTRGVTVTAPRPSRPRADATSRAAAGTAAAPGAGRSSLVPRLTVALTMLLLMVVVTVHAASPLRNSDTWFHLRIGHELWGSWSLAHPGALSSFATEPWLPTQWSTEMLAARMEDWFGLPGVAWLFGALFLLFIVAVYACCRRLAGPLPACVATGLAVVGATPALSARPQVVSLVLLAVVVASWLRSAETLRAPWHLVPLTWVWATAHGLWTTGLVVGVVCCAGILLDRRPDLRTALRLMAVPVLSGVAACLTPLGPHLVSSQLAVGARASLIVEWGPTSFRELPAFVVAAMLGITVLRWARSREVPWTQIFLLMVACGWTALVTRMVSSGGVVAAPLLAAALQQLLQSRSPWVRARRSEWALLATAVVVLLAALAVAAPRTAQQAAQVPTGFTTRLASLPSGTPVAVEGGVGSWVEYRFPGLDPTIDGMLDAYPVGYIRDYVDFKDVKPGWTGFLRRTHAEVAITEKGSALTAAMEAQLHWRKVAEDGEFVYLVAPAS